MPSERDALSADSDELRGFGNRLTGLMRRLKQQGIINAARWEEFFGEPQW